MVAFHAGDEHAFRMLFQRYRDPVIGYAGRMLHDVAAGEDICVEAFVRLYNGVWRPSGRFRAFLFTMVHRLCLDHMRSERRRRKLHAAPEPPPPPIDPETHAAAREKAEEMEAAMASLPDKYRSTLLLYYHSELSCAEVGEALSCNVSQVKSRLAYGRKLLKQALETP